jgi:hypothetical protein
MCKQIITSYGLESLTARLKEMPLIVNNVSLHTLILMEFVQFKYKGVLITQVQVLCRGAVKFAVRIV